MSLHAGFLAAPTSSDALLAELKRHSGNYVIGEPLPKPFVIQDGPEAKRWNLALGQHDGKAYLFDPEDLFASDPDLVVAISEPLGLVVGGFVGASLGIGSFTLARSGELVRHLRFDRDGMSEDFTLGDPLATEDEQPLDDGSGSGLYAAFALVGLPLEPWLEHGPAVGLTFTEERWPPGGPIGLASEEHADRYETAHGRAVRAQMEQQILAWVNRRPAGGR